MKSGKLVLTCVKAELTRDTEFIGKMDPFVEVKMGSLKKKTTVKKSAGKKPIWNEALTFELNSADPSSTMTITVLDEDVTTNDIVGSVDVPLSRFLLASGTTSAETWIDILWKNKTSGKICLTSQWTEASNTTAATTLQTAPKLPANNSNKVPAEIIKKVEGSGILELTLSKAELTRDTEFIGKMDPYVVLKHGSQEFKSDVKKDAGKNPIWNQKFKIEVANAQESLQITVFDKDVMSSDTVGSTTVPIAQLCSGSQQSLEISYKNKPAGQVFLTGVWNPGPLPRKPAENKQPVQPATIPTRTYPAVSGTGFLEVTCVKATLTRDTETFGKMDPYVEMTLRQDKYKTKYLDGAGKTPVWNEILKLKVEDATESVKIAVLDKDTMSSDLVGDITVPLSHLCAGGPYTAQLSYKGKNVGTLELNSQWKPGPIATVAKPITRNYPPVKGTGFLHLNVQKAVLTRDTEMFGKMDPFVQVMCRQEKYKTKTLNGAGKTPEWNQILRITVHDASENVTLTVFDEDVTTNDRVGEVSIPLSHLCAGAYEATILHKGKGVGTVTLFGEWKPGSIELKPKQVNYPNVSGTGFLDITVVKGTLTRDTETFGKMDPYVVFSLGTMKVKTRTLDGAGKTPVWNETLQLKIPDATQIIKMTVFDKDVTSDDIVGESQIPLSHLCFGGSYLADITYKGKNAGSVQLNCNWKPGPIEKVYKAVRGSGNLHLTVVKASLTRDTEMFGKMDPYVQIEVRQDKYNTKVLNGAGKTPVWNQTFRIPIHEASESCKLTVLDEDNIGSDTVGSVTIPINHLCAGGEYQTTIQHKNKSAGIVYLRSEWKAGPLQQAIVPTGSKKSATVTTTIQAPHTKLTSVQEVSAAQNQPKKVAAPRQNNLKQINKSASEKRIIDVPAKPLLNIPKFTQQFDISMSMESSSPMKNKLAGGAKLGSTMNQGSPVEESMAYSHHAATVQSMRLEDSVANNRGGPNRIPGLTEFLRSEYYRRMGVYTNRCRDEQNKLLGFWKENVSEVYRKMREDKLAARKADPFAQTQTRPNTAKSTTSNQSKKSRSGSAVPMPKQDPFIFSDHFVYKQYEQFKLCYELDVAVTIEKDLEEEQMVEKQREIQMQAKMEAKYAQQLLQEHDEATDYMLKIYFFGSPPEIKKPAVGAAVDVKPDAKMSIKEMMTNEVPNKYHYQVDFSKHPQEQVDGFKYISGLCKLSKRQLNKTSNDPAEMIQVYQRNITQFQQPLSDRDAQQFIRNFFSGKEFIVRLILHQKFVNKSKTKASVPLTQYFIQLNKSTRQINLVDHPQAQKEIDLFMNAGKDQTKENKDQNAVQDPKKKQPDMNRISRLANPKDKWKVGKRLLELQKQFPHDRVLQRMIKEEFSSNQVFKYPEEYDIYDKNQEGLCKIEPTEVKGLQDKQALYEKSQAKLEEFRTADNSLRNMDKRNSIPEKKARLNFERDMIAEAQNYQVQASKRLELEQGKRETIRQALTRIYQTLLVSHGPVMNKMFPFLSAKIQGMDPDSETYKKSFPDSFKRHFFRVIKAMGSKKGMTVGQVRNRTRKLPPAFVISAGVARCTLHEITCPTSDCPYVSNNKKIVMGKSAAKVAASLPIATRSRVWYRQEGNIQSKLKDVFMTESEAQNCTFEPLVGSMNPNKLYRPPQEYFNEPTVEDYAKKHGKNFQNTHPEVYKLGILKKAQLQIRQGEFKKAMSTMSEGFNIISLKKHFDPKYMKWFIAERMQKAKQEREAKEKAEKEAEEAKKKEAMGVKQDPAAKKLTNIDDLRETVAETQKKMKEEDFKNKKLLHVLREAYDLVVSLEDREKEANKKIQSIQKSKVKLYKRKENADKLVLAEDQAQNPTMLFKTIMCPMKERCSKLKRNRWPMSSIKAVTKFGAACPYAHHPMELQFPETILTKLASSTQMVKQVKAAIETNKPNKPFVPAGPLYNCTGCSQRCNMCIYRAKNLPKNTLADQKKKDALAATIKKREGVHDKEHHEEMLEITKKLNLDENYFKKFGLLKKSAVLLFYGRTNDAFDEIAKAVDIIKTQKELEKEKSESIQKRWKFKLGLDEGFELPFPLDKIHPNDIDDKMLQQCDLQPGMNISTIRLYIDNVSPFKWSEFSKNEFINRCIEQMYLDCEAIIEGKVSDIAKMKAQVEKLDELADMAEMFGDDGPPPEGMIGDDGEPIKIKQKKIKACKTFIETGKCPNIKNKTCKFSHNPMELELITPDIKVKNLNGVIASQTHKLRYQKAQPTFVPAGKQDIMDKSVFAPYQPKTEFNEEGDKDEDKPKSIFERENVFRKPYEEKD